ncbi:MAG: hypothetical protein ACPGWR_22185 [Ardenticatenaceae bacterium]
MPPTIRIIFWLIALISLVVAAVWYYNEPGFEPLLALLGTFPAILEMMISSRGENTSLKRSTGWVFLFGDCRPNDGQENQTSQLVTHLRLRG